MATFPTEPGDGGGVTLPVAVADGGTGATDAAGARTALGVAAADAASWPVLRLRSQLPVATGTFTLADGVAYFVYLGQTNRSITVTEVECVLTNPGSGSQIAEIGLASSTTPPNGNNKSLTKIVASGSMDNIVSGSGPRGPATPFAQVIAAGTHLWAMMRSACTGTEAVTMALFADAGQGAVLTLAASGALTDAGPWIGVVPTTWNASAISPDLIVTFS